MIIDEITHDWNAMNDDQKKEFLRQIAILIKDTGYNVTEWFTHVMNEANQNKTKKNESSKDQIALQEFNNILNEIKQLLINKNIPIRSLTNKSIQTFLIALSYLQPEKSSVCINTDNIVSFIVHHAKNEENKLESIMFIYNRVNLLFAKITLSTFLDGRHNTVSIGIVSKESIYDVLETILKEHNIFFDDPSETISEVIENRLMFIVTSIFNHREYNIDIYPISKTDNSVSMIIDVSLKSREESKTHSYIVNIGNTKDKYSVTKV